jgi:uncharacterized protein YprB with RNaseH-like and TPR domain
MGLPPDVFKRLSLLNRERLRDQVTTGDRLAPPAPARPKEVAAGLSALLESLVPGRERKSAAGRFYHVRRMAEEVQGGMSTGGDEEADTSDLVSRYRRVFHGEGIAVAREALPQTLQPLLAARPERIMYMDIETCGLAGEPLFLIGLMRWTGTILRVDQLLARDYSEEAAVLQAFWEEMAGAECLVTFNGKSFDVPTILLRGAVARISDPPPLPTHVDLLHEARRRWKRQLPNCRLQTLEQWICQRWRIGDIPSGQIPAAYHAFVQARQGGDADRLMRSHRQMQSIIHHNALDLLTMADLVAYLLSESP